MVGTDAFPGVHADPAQVRTEFVDCQIDAQRPVNLAAIVMEMREFVFKNVMQLQTLLRENPSQSKAALARQIGQLKLTPEETENGPVYEVNGALDLLNENDVVPVVARDGIEPPTRGFSVRCSTS